MIDKTPRTPAKNSSIRPWTIERLLEPMSLPDFLAQVFGRKPWFRVTAEDSASIEFDSLLDWESLNVLLGLQSCWSPENFRLVRDNRPLPPETYSQRIGKRTPVLRPIPSLVEQSMQSGSTLVLNGVDGVCRPIADLLDSLEAATVSRGQANVYVSQVGKQGFGIHYDAHDTLVLHLAGMKQWRLYAKPAIMPDRTMPAANVLRTHAGPVLHELTLKPGDLLYIPAGFCHEAVAVKNQSMHLTVALKQVTRLDILNVAIEHMLERQDSLGHHQYDLYRGEAAIHSHLQAILADFENLFRDPSAVNTIAKSLTSTHRVRGGYRLPTFETKPRP